MSIFDKRIAFKPFEYPEIVKFKEAINHSYWLVTEWNFTSDVQDFNVTLNEVERSAVKNTLLAISQIEVAVKKFWTKLGDRFPKPEIEQVGVTCGESEVRHADAYSHLLQILNLNDEFLTLLDNEAIKGRVDYLNNYLANADKKDNKNYTLVLTLFSIFIENVSLFSQFAIIKSFNKYKNVLKDIDNVVQATQKEECYVDGTEVLTPNGWVSLKDINVGDNVVQYNNGKLEFVNVQNKVDRDYSGNVYHIYNNNSNCMVTPNHDMVYYDRNGVFKKVTAQKFIPDSRKFLPHSGLLNNPGESVLSFNDRLKIAIQADGSNMKWKNKFAEIKLRGKNNGCTHVICLTKTRKKERLEWILSQGNIPYSKHDHGQETIYRIKFNHDDNYKQFDWVNLHDKTYQWCREFVHECIEWDGYKTQTSGGYSSTNKKAIDKVQAIAILAGYKTNIYIRQDLRKDTFSTCYKLSFIDNKFTAVCHGLNKEIQQFSGKVYCITVASGVIITRYNNKTMIAGNCVHALLGVYIINEVKKEFPAWFDQQFYDRIYAASEKAYAAECKIVDWIFEKGELTFLSKDTVKEFIKDRLNDSIKMIGGNEVFTVDNTKLASLQWFNDEIHGEVSTDFFHKRPVTYSKKVHSITAEDLF
jgi:ribonucleotide reductase beta subunit family protein with ferritin-like domain